MWTPNRQESILFSMNKNIKELFETVNLEFSNISMAIYPTGLAPTNFF